MMLYRMLKVTALLVLSMPVWAETPQESTPAELKAKLEAFLTAVDEPESSSLLRAEQIREKRLDSFPRGGPDAVAGVGDWWLSNGKVCAAVSDIGHDGGIVGGGGTLVDVFSCDGANDQWTYANMLTGLAKETAIINQKISAEVTDGYAEITTVGEADGLRQTIHYRLREDSDALDIEVQILRIGDGRAVRMSGLFTLYSQRSLTPFSLSSYTPEATLGFQHPEIDRSSISSLINGLKASDWNILVGSDNYESAISYGVQLRSAELIKANGSRQTLPRFLAVFPNYSLHGWMSRPLWLNSDKLNWMSMLQNQFMDIEQGERLVASFQVLLGGRADVASVTDQIYRGAQLRGYSNHPGVSFAVWDQSERPVSQTRVDKDGSFSIRLPKGTSRVRLKATAPWGQEMTRELNISDARNDSGRWFFKKKGQLQLPQGKAMSMTFFGIGDTPNPEFGRDLLGFTENALPVHGSMYRNRVDLAGVDSDPLLLDLPPGQYRVIGSRGIEYETQEYLLTIIPGMTSVLPMVAPKRIWQGEDWLSADLHVHSGASFDSTLPFSERLRSFVAQGAELLVASEHNRIVDYQDYPEKMALTDQVQVVTGTELTGLARSASAPFTIGHSNVFPVKAEAKQYSGGIIPVENQRLREVIAGAKQHWPEAVFQLNHPRAMPGIDADLAFFDHLSIGSNYDPDQLLVADINRSLLEVDQRSGFRDIDFDVIEVLNGSEFSVYAQLRKDWFSLLNQGAVRTATGNSDSHDLHSPVAAPRNYIYMPSHGALPVSEADFTQALLEGRSFFTTGPLIDVVMRNGEGDEARLGDVLKAKRAELHVQIEAASWVPVDTLNVWVNGELYRSTDAAAGDHAVIELISQQDAYIVVEVKGKGSAAYKQLLPELEPLAVSNPIFLDADGDGKWSPPIPLKPASLKGSG